MSLATILKDYIDASPVVFGRVDAPQSRRPPVDRETLVRRLDAQAAFNNRLILITIGAYLAVLALICGLAIAHHDSTVWLGAALGGNLLVLVAKVAFLRDLWREKNYTDMLLAVLPSLTPDEAVKVIEGLYFGKLDRGVLTRGAGEPA